MTVDPSQRTRRGLQLFTRDEPRTGGKMFQMIAGEPGSINHERLAEYHAARASAGQVLFIDEEGTEDSTLSVVWLHFASGYTVPRHSHNVDCLYFVAGGQAILGNRTLNAGDGFFAPAHSPYGYTAGPDGLDILEFHGDFKPVSTTQHESDAGWERIMADVRANRDDWVSEMEPYRQWMADGSAPNRAAEMVPAPNS